MRATLMRQIFSERDAYHTFWSTAIYCRFDLFGVRCALAPL